jgi:hypothetical protein
VKKSSILTEEESEKIMSHANSDDNVEKPQEVIDTTEEK